MNDKTGGFVLRYINKSEMVKESDHIFPNTRQNTLPYYNKSTNINAKFFYEQLYFSSLYW